MSLDFTTKKESKSLEKFYAMKVKGNIFLFYSLCPKLNIPIDFFDLFGDYFLINFKTKMCYWEKIMFNFIINNR